MEREADNLIFLIRNILENELKLLKRYGVDQLGYRYFLPDGRSFGCPTAKIWYETVRTEEFYAALKESLSQELLRLHKNNFSYVTRSREHKSIQYFNWLERMNLGNSVGIYKFGDHRIDSFFFILESGNGEQKDLLINNIKWLEKHVNSLSRKMNGLHGEMQRVGFAEMIIDKDICEQIFSNPSGQKYISFSIDGQSIKLSSREIDILSFLSSAASNKAIAHGLGVHEKTIEKYIFGLKNKFSVNSKNELINIANKPQLHILFRNR